MMLTNAGVDTTTAAARRRQRRLRSWLRHEQMTFAMLLAERDHHTPHGDRSRPGAGGELERDVNYEPRLLDLPLPQEAATVGYVAAPVPLLAQPVLGGGDTLDAAAVQFLLAQSLLQRQRDEEEAAEEAKEKEERKAKFEEKMLVVNRRVRDGAATPAEEAAWRRWMGLVPGSSCPLVERGGRRRRGRGSSRSLPLVPLPVMDAPVILNDESQQSKKFEFMVPRTQFIDDVWTFSLCYRDRYVVLWYRKLWSFRSCSSSLAVDIPFVAQKLIPMVQSAQQIMEILQLLLLLVVDVPVVQGRAGSQVLPWRRPWRSHSCSSLRNL